MSETKQIMEKLTDLNKLVITMREANDAALKEAEARNSEKRAEDVEKLQKIDADFVSLRTAVDELTLKLQRPQLSDKQENDQQEHRATFERFLRYGEKGLKEKDWQIVQELRALSPASDSDGGFVVPPMFESEILMKAHDLGAIRQVARVLPTGRDSVIIPNMTKPTIGWGVVNVETSATNLNSGASTIPINDLIGIYPIHNNTLEDSDADIFMELSDAFGRTIAETEDTAFAIGSDPTSPKGIFNNTTITTSYFVKSGVAADISDATYNGIDALMSVMATPKKAYSVNGVWAFSRATEAAIWKLKDKDGRYHWSPPTQPGVPAMLLGRPIINPESAPAIGAGTFPVVFGDFNAGYRIYDRRGLTVVRDDSVYRAKNQVAFFVTKRVGANVVMPEAFACLKIAA